MLKKGFNIEGVLTVSFLLSVFILAAVKIEDTDAWTHLRFGKWIWDNRAIPLEEPFISTSRPFPYTNWLFGFIYYLAYHAFDIYGVILLKAATVTTGFYILFRDSLRPYKNYIAAVIVMVGIVVISRHRFVERPDTFLMIFLPFSIYALNAFVYDNKKYIYALPFIHMAWANSHSSIVLMFIPFMSFIAGGVMQRLLNKRFSAALFPDTPSRSQLKTIIVIFAASFAASLISPYFTDQYTFGAQALSADWWKHEITELQKPTWESFKAPFILTPVLIFSFILSWVMTYRSRLNPPIPPLAKGGEGGFKGNGGQVSAVSGQPLIHFLLLIPFIYLSFTALRFTFLLAIVAGPVLARNLSSYLQGLNLNRKSLIALLILWIALYCTFSVLHIKPFDMTKEKVSGFGINYDHVPEGALRYMDRKNITGMVFNLFQWGGYITWRDFPKRRAFIDGRGFLSSELLEKTDLARRNPSVLDTLEAKYSFDAVLLNYPVMQAGVQMDAFAARDIALSHPDWALVYWDDLSLLYLKRNGRYADAVKEDEYKRIKPANGVSGIRAGLHDEDYRSDLFRELTRNIQETGSSKAYAYLGFLYNELGLYDKAIDSLSKVRDFVLVSHLPEAYSGIGYAYINLGNFEKSIKYYKKSLDMVEDAATLYNIGIAYTKKGEKKRAIKYLKRALDMNKNLTSIYPVLIGLYNEFGMTDDAGRTAKLYESAAVEKKGEDHFKKGLAAYLESKLDIAAEEFKKSIEANPSNPAAYSNLGYVYFDLNMLDRAFMYQKKAVDIDPNFANAHYGLALIYRQRNDKKAAVHHWEEYLRIEPAGYYSRRAKEEIEAIKDR